MISGPGVALVALLSVGAATGGAPDFRQSTITASRTSIHPLETIEYTITIRNSGTRAPSYLRVANDIPPAAMF
ncbi:MAG: hypothetical protein ACLGH0_01135, partial [Thermoanaerobaculia bacterium]